VIQFFVVGYAGSNNEIKVAFIRNDDLWVKIGDQEKKITSGGYVRNPKWSYDGQWLAYSRGQDESEIWIYDLKKGKGYPFKGHNFQWSPNQNILAFQSDKVLNITDTHSLDSHSFENVALGVGNFSWLPDGNGFLVSSISNLLPTGWTSVELFIVPIEAKLDRKKIKYFYTLPGESNDFFAVMTSSFKWSSDQKWIAFLGIPTASLSADSNSLLVISSDGTEFKKLDPMLRDENWFKWAPGRNLLAYIEGEGRFALQNKHLKVKEMPVYPPSLFTPQGFVDRGFTWHNDQIITVSRTRESKWTADPADRPLPLLYQVNISTHEQKKITSPLEDTGDFYPTYLTDTEKITWIRSDRKKANVWIANSDGTNAEVWVKNIDLGPNYYENWNWSTVISWYSADLRN
jgi:Tol biopolymer transport system component